MGDKRGFELFFRGRWLGLKIVGCYLQDGIIPGRLHLRLSRSSQQGDSLLVSGG